MRITAMVVVAVLAGLSARAAQVEETVTVYLSNRVIVPNQVWFACQDLAAQMFATAGVRIVWRFGLPADLGSGRDQAIVVKMLQDTPTKYHPGSVAMAFPYKGASITVFYDRVKQTAPATVTPALLAHVLVHEITHVLEGTDFHSESGVMKAQWGAEDYLAMQWKPLMFTEEDFDLIHQGLAARVAAGVLSGGNALTKPAEH